MSHQVSSGISKECLHESIDISKPITKSQLLELLPNNGNFLKSLSFRSDHETFPRDFWTRLTTLCPNLESIEMTQVELPENVSLFQLPSTLISLTMRDCKIGCCAFFALFYLEIPNLKKLTLVETELSEYDNLIFSHFRHVEYKNSKLNLKKEL